jgi:hypothetical protein
LHTG